MEASGSARANTPAPEGAGWATFAASLFFLLGAFNIVYGIVALAKEEYFDGELLFGDISLWGVIFLVAGVIKIGVAAGIFRGSSGAAVVGVVLVILNAIGHLLAIGAYPIYSIIILVVDVLVLYALTVYPNALKQT